uniref:Uncharacterized protein n=1 Tax=Rhizophora mucronata TaxID=61149 RepID=A0A2P2QZP0_RHIMU
MLRNKQHCKGGPNGGSKSDFSTIICNATLGWICKVILESEVKVTFARNIHATGSPTVQECNPQLKIAF